MSIAPLTPSSTHWIDDILVRICLWLQLTPTQRSEAEQHYRAVGRWLGADESALSAWDPDIFPQGSLRIGTTVRPTRYEEFDLDLVCLLQMSDGENAIEVLNLVERRLRKHGTYAPMVERKNRCIRLNFAKQFHMDILPARPDSRLGGTCVLVPDRAARAWKESNPKGFANWFDDKGALLPELSKFIASVEPLAPPEGAEEKNPLQLSVQLFKRARDIRFANQPDLAPISIVLTTLAGNHYQGELHPLSALSNIVDRICDSIPPVGRLRVLNPRNPLEDLSECWDNNRSAYKAFVDFARDLSRELHEVQRAEGIQGAKKQLERLFGSDAAERAIRDQASAVEASRKRSELRVLTGSGAITSASSPASVPVRRNTFYGD